MKEKTQHWLVVAENDLEFAKSILQNKQRPHYAVHFCHQAIEKILKAIVQEHTQQEPKRTHNFKVLCEQGEIAIPKEVEDFLIELGPHYLASRYPTDLRRFFKEYDLEYVTVLLKKSEETFQWLKNYLKSKNQ